MSENGDASAPAPVVDRDLHPYSIQAFLNAIHLDDLSATRRSDHLRITPRKSLLTANRVPFVGSRAVRKLVIARWAPAFARAPRRPVQNFSNCRLRLSSTDIIGRESQLAELTSRSLCRRLDQLPVAPSS